MATDNKLFVVSGVSQPEKLEARIQQQFPESNIAVSGGWLIAGPTTMTTMEVCEKLGITGEGEPVSAGLVASVSAYFGRAPQTVWEWINSKVGTANAASGQ